MEVIYVYTVLGVCLRFRNDILLRAVTYVHNVPRGDILRWVSREAREKKIEKVNGWRKENDTWRRGGEAIPLSVSSFPSSCLSYLCSSSNLFLYLSLSLSFAFLFFRPTLVSRAPRSYDPTRAKTRTRTRNVSCSPRSPRNSDDCNLHKLSFHFDDDVAKAPTEWRSEE